jgi:MFS family permease
MPRSASLFISPLFKKFWSARACTSLAFQMQGVAVGWQIYSITHSAFYLGLVGLAQFLPMFCLTLVVGHVADRYNRRRIILICQIIEGLAAAALAIGSIKGIHTKESILAIVFILGSSRAFEGPTLQALLPSLVTKSNLPRAFAWSSSAFQIASIAGPAIGGFLYSVHASVVYGLASCLFLTASIMIFSIPTTSASAQKKKKAPITAESVLAGIRYIKHKPIILGSISLDLFAVLFGGATALLPVFASDILHTGPWGLGLLRSAPSIGALAMSFYLIYHPLRREVGKKMFLAVALFGAMTIVFGLSQFFLLSLAALIILGAADMISVVIRQTLVQLGTPDAMRGRVSAVNSMFIGTSNQLGEFESGVTAALFGTVPAVVIGGAGTLLVVGLWARLFPELRKADRLKR